MPIAVASASKQNIGQSISFKMGDLFVITTSSAGNAGGTTAVSTSLAGEADDFYADWWLLQTSGANVGEWRRVTDFVQSTSTLTVGRAFTAQVASGVTMELHKYRPDLLFTLAPNEARFRAYQTNFAVYKQEIDYLLVESARSVYGVPRGMRNVFRVSQARHGALLNDLFDRADSTTSIGGSWTATTGVWGISSERGYSVDDNDADLITYDANVKDGVLSCIVRGTLNSGATYRSPALVFRLVEDRTGAIPAAASRSYLLVRMLNAQVDLRRVLAGTESSLATAAVTTTDGVDYRLKVIFEGSYVRVLLDDIEVITHRLIEPSLSILEGTRVGVRWDKGGSPATAARIDDFRIHSLQSGYVEHHDWSQSADKRILELGALGRQNGLYGDRYLKLEGGDLLTAGADDTTAGTIASLTTAVFEVETTDPAYDVFADFGAWCAWEKQALPGVGEPEDLTRYAAEAEKARLRALLNARANGMSVPTTAIRRPY